MKQVSLDIINAAWPIDEKSVLDIEVEQDRDRSYLMLNFHLSLQAKLPVRDYIREKAGTVLKGIHADIDEAIEIGLSPRYQVVFKWEQDNDLPDESIATLQQHLYTGLGLSRADIRKLTDLDLTEILEKIREQQDQLQKQKQQIQAALTKIEHDLEAAREAQMNLLPKELIGVDEVEFRARFIPSQYVSGDIYNVFRLDEHHMGAYHIDISGHGVPAALFSVSLSQMLNTNISSRNLLKIPASEPPYYKINAPDAVFSMLDEEHSFEQYDIFFTMVYMVINLKTRVVRYSRAGHNPPVILRSSGEVLIPEEGGLPIGWGLPREDNVCELTLEPGDRIYLYSDGITEAFNKDEDIFGQERLVSLLRENRDVPLEKGLDMLLDELRKYTGNQQFEDDISIIGLSWKD